MLHDVVVIQIMDHLYTCKSSSCRKPECYFNLIKMKWITLQELSTFLAELWSTFATFLFQTLTFDMTVLFVSNFV